MLVIRVLFAAVVNTIQYPVTEDYLLQYIIQSGFRKPDHVLMPPPGAGGPAIRPPPPHPSAPTQPPNRHPQPPHGHSQPSHRPPHHNPNPQIPPKPFTLQRNEPTGSRVNGSVADNGKSYSTEGQSSSKNNGTASSSREEAETVSGEDVYGMPSCWMNPPDPSITYGFEEERTVSTDDEEGFDSGDDGNDILPPPKKRRSS